MAQVTLMSVTERARVWRLLAQAAWQSLLRWVHGGPMFRWRLFSATPARLIIAPQDLRTADGTNAADIYAGRFLFAGQFVETSGQSPFEVPAPSADWARALHGFGWLRHLKAAETVVARQNARALVDDWIRSCGYWQDTAWEQIGRAHV